MPDIGEGIAEIEIIEWRVQVGDEIAPDQIVAMIETDKSMVEMPTPLSGTVTVLGAEVGEMLPVGAVLIAVDTKDDATIANSESKSSDDSPVSPNQPSSGEPSVRANDPSAASSMPRSRVKAAPSVRRLAMERGVDLVGIKGTGPGGRVTNEDVVGASRTELSPPTEASATTSQEIRSSRSAGIGEMDLADERVPLRGLRRQIAKSMSESWRTVPHITDYREVEATHLIELRDALREAWPEHAAVLTYVPIFVKVAATALERHPLMNASFHEEASEYILHRRINIGVATATSDGLLVPVIRNADRKSILELALEFGELVDLARTRKASLEQLTGGTYTVNNVGAIGSTVGTPLIHTPEVGITAFGRIVERVVARDGVPVVRRMLTVSSVGDHRLHDGDTLGSFTTTLVRLLENPSLLLAELS